MYARYLAVRKSSEVNCQGLEKREKRDPWGPRSAGGMPDNVLSLRAAGVIARFQSEVKVWRC